MAENYEEKAITSLVSSFTNGTTGFNARLREIETDLGLTPNSIKNPVAIVGAQLPFDNRSPLIQIFDEASIPINHRNKLGAVDCTVGITFNSGTDISAAELTMRRYVRAARMVLNGDPKLGNTVVAAFWTDQNRNLAINDDSTTRHARAIGVEVHVHDP